VSFPRYFFSCNACDATDHGTPLYAHEIVECPSCGSRNLEKWEALDNLSREWSFCEVHGHEWTSYPRDPTDQWCARCGAKRKLEVKAR
jgi:DNA-directed RNA polymerase subunit RPC12/RpoP